MGEQRLGTKVTEIRQPGYQENRGLFNYSTMLTTNRIKELLENSIPVKNPLLRDFEIRLSGTHPTQAAAILMPLLQIKKEWHLLFIKRTKHAYDQHSGQVAFPGGRVEENDEDLLATALREAEEEIKLNPSDVNVLGCLSDIHTVTNFLVRPIVGEIPWPYAFEPDPNEVSRIFTIPLLWLADPNNYDVRPWTPSQEVTKPYPIIFFKEYEGEILWGASARMMVDLIERLHF